MVIAMRFPSSRTARRSPQPSGDTAALVALAYELLDPHADTSRLTGDETSDAEPQNHPAYLRDLQRVGREMLADAVAVDGDRPRVADRGRTGSWFSAR
jgi:hypothetical protein